MAFRSFQDFLEQLERTNELQRIHEPVATDLVIAEWANREMKSPGGGKALLFEKPMIDGKTSAFPVAINTMGSRKRIAMALGVNDVADLAQEIHLIYARPKKVKEGACQEVVRILDSGSSMLDKKHPVSSIEHPASNGITLSDLPILKCWT